MKQISDNPDESRVTRREWRMALSVALLAMLIRLPVCFKGFWIDEYYTLRTARLHLGELIADRISIGHFPLYFIYAKWGLLLGEQEWVLRLTSLLALALTIVMLTGLLGALGQRRYLPTAWLLALFHPDWVTIGTEYRYMMPLVAAATATTWACVSYTRNPTWRHMAILIALAVLTTAIHPVAIFGVLALAAFLALEPVKRSQGGLKRQILAHSFPLVFSMISVSPMFWSIRNVQILNNPPHPPKWSRHLSNLFEITFGRPYFWNEWLGRYNLRINKHLMLWLMGLALLLAIWGARRELLRRGHHLTWRLILTLLIVFPGVYLIFSSFVLNVHGASRYWCILSIPSLLLLTYAWHAPLHPWLRLAYRGLLVTAIGLQFIAAMLDRGDLQREAAQWIVRNHRPEDKVLVARGEAFFDVFPMLGYTGTQDFGILDTYERSSRDIATSLGQQLESDSRLLLMLYRPHAKIEKVLIHVLHSGKAAKVRLWKLNKQTSVVALARDATDLQWLQSLPNLQRPWGTSRGDH